jgi:hypothetical protein
VTIYQLGLVRRAGSVTSPAEGVHAPRDLRLGHEPGQVGGHVGGERCVEFVRSENRKPSLGG